jgi:hypothetical protein
MHMLTDLYRVREESRFHCLPPSSSDIIVENRICIFGYTQYCKFKGLMSPDEYFLKPTVKAPNFDRVFMENIFFLRILLGDPT